MKKINFFLLLIFTIKFTTGAFAQTATADASLRILIPISIVNNTELNFGYILASNSAGRVTLTPAGVRSRTGGATFLPSLAGPVSVAQFTVTGEPNATFTITLPNNSALKLSKPGGVDMRVQTFKHSLTSTSSRKLSPTGVKVFTVGATLRVNASQSPGAYTGEFHVTVAYN